MKRVLCFLLMAVLIVPLPLPAEEAVSVDQGGDDPVGDVLFFPFRVLGEVFSTSGYEYDPDRQYAWYPDNYYYRYWNDPWYYDRYDYYRYRYRHGGSYFGYYGGYHRGYRHHGGGHHRGGGHHGRSGKNCK